MSDVLSFLSLNATGRLAYYLIHLISIVGVFSLLSRCVNLRSPILLLPSLYLGPLFLFIFSGLFQIPLFPASVLVFLLSILGLFFIQPVLQDQKTKSALYLFLLWSFVLSLYGQTPYLPTQWDEFSHWLTYPVQLTQAGVLVSEKFYNLLTLSYPPLYPLTLAYPNLLLSLDPLKSNYMIVPLLSWIALFAGIYPYFKNAFFGLTLPLIFSFLFLRGLPTDVLIEWPQLHLLSLLFILASGGVPIGKKAELILLGLLTTLLIFLKNSNFFVLVPLVLFLTSRKQLKHGLILSASILIFTIPALMIWKSQTSFVDYPFQPGGLTQLSSQAFLKASATVFFKMLKKLFNFLGHIEVIAALVILYFNRGKISVVKALKNPVSVSLIAYFLLMFIMYICFFNPYEARRIASFERYYSLMLLPLCFTVFFNERKKIANFLKPIKKNYLVVGLVVIGIFRFIEPQIRIQGEAHKFMSLWKKVDSSITASEPQGLFISQGDDGSDLVQIRYASLQSFPKTIDWASAFSFSANPQNYWAKDMGKNFYKSLDKYDFILLYKGDQEMGSQLAKLSGVQYKMCLNGDQEQPVLLRREGKGWVCQKLL